MNCFKKDKDRQPLLIDNENKEARRNERNLNHYGWGVMIIGIIIASVGFILALSSTDDNLFNSRQMIGLCVFGLGIAIGVLGALCSGSRRLEQAFGGCLQGINGFFYNCCHDTPSLSNEPSALQL